MGTELSTTTIIDKETGKSKVVYLGLTQSQKDRGCTLKNGKLVEPKQKKSTPKKD